MSTFVKASINDENAALRIPKAGTAPVAAAVQDAGPVTRRQRAALGDVSTGAANAGPGQQMRAGPRSLSSLVGRPVGSGPMAVAPPMLGAAAEEADMSTFSMAEGLPDVDAADAHIPEMVADYAAEIFRHHKAAESHPGKIARHGYMAHQTDINERMRAILIDWLVDVHLKFKLMPETLYLTVNLIDRFLERKLVVRQKLQLVGVTAMLLASKYEEIFAPEVNDFVFITDKAYTRDQILAMEASMLNALEFRISVPTAWVFLSRFLKIAEADQRTSLLATFYVERTLQEYRFLQYAPSRVAAAAVNIALRTLRGPHAWTPVLASHSGYTQEDLRSCVLDIQFTLDNPSSTLVAVVQKYSLTKFQEVARIVRAGLE